MARAAFAVLAVVAVLSAAIQLASDGLFGRAAASPAFPRIVPRAVGLAVYDGFDALPFAPSFVRRVAAEAAIDDGRLDEAQRLIAREPAGRDRSDLEGRWYAAHDDAAAAVERFVAAGDFVRVGEAVDDAQREGHLEVALRTQRRLVDELQALHDTDSLARAYWRLAQLEAATGDHRASLVDYQTAIAFEPLSETYLLGAANEALGHGRLELARRYFVRVVQLDPGSADGHVGVGRVAVRAGDLEEARRQAAIVRRLAPRYGGLELLEREIGS